MGKKKKKIRPLPESLGLSPIGIDTHAHLDMEDFPEEELDEVLAQARKSGVARIGNVFLSVDAYEQGRARFANHPSVFFTLAQHPNDTNEFDTADIDRMRECFENDPRLKAVGETGLDYYWDDVPHEVQQKAFRLHLGLARELDLPVVIHSRDADEDTIAILLDEGFKDRPLLWHCFGGGPELAERILDNDWHISIPGPVSYAKNHDLRVATMLIPLNRLVIETDAPYLTPEPWRGKRNHPALVAFTAAKVAEVKAMRIEDIWRTTARTARRFFNLDDA